MFKELITDTKTIIKTKAPMNKTKKHGAMITYNSLNTKKRREKKGGGKGRIFPKYIQLCHQILYGLEIGKLDSLIAQQGI